MLKCTAGIKSNLERKYILTTLPHKYTTNDPTTRLVCNKPTEECFANECDSCSINKRRTQVFVEDVSDDIEFDDVSPWMMWKKVNNKFDLHKVTASIDSLLTEMDEQWPSFLHSYCNRQQREYIALLRAQSSNKSFIIA